MFINCSQLNNYSYYFNICRIIFSNGYQDPLLAHLASVVPLDDGHTLSGLGLVYIQILAECILNVENTVVFFLFFSHVSEVPRLALQIFILTGVDGWTPLVWVFGHWEDGLAGRTEYIVSTITLNNSKFLIISILSWPQNNLPRIFWILRNIQNHFLI